MPYRRPYRGRQTFRSFVRGSQVPSPYKEPVMKDVVREGTQAYFKLCMDFIPVKNQRAFEIFMQAVHDKTFRFMTDHQDARVDLELADCLEECQQIMKYHELQDVAELPKPDVCPRCGRPY